MIPARAQRSVVFITDMDGTLLDDRSCLPAENLTAIQHLVECGGDFTVASGRSPRAITMYEQLLPLITLPIIACNGACIYDLASQSYLRLLHLPNTLASVAVTLMAQYPTFGCMVFQGDGSRIVTVRRDRFTDEVVIRRERAPMDLCPCSQIPQPWSKLVFSSADTAALARCARWVGRHVEGVSVTITEQIYLEVLPAGVSKGDAVAALSQQVHIPLSNFVALGDSANDLELLQVCGVGAVVANADPALRTLIPHHCAGHNDGGAADCIRHFVLPRLPG